MFATEAGLYLKERILRPRIGLLWLFLLACTVPVAGVGWLWMFPTTVLFILAFRLWDDLADLDHDRAHHPGRVLVRSLDLRPFHAVHWGLLAATALALTGGARTATFLALVATMLANYRLTAGRPALRPLRVALVLAKYPALVLLVAGQPGEPNALGAAAAAYLVPLADEVRDSGTAVLAPAALLSALALLAGWTLLN